MVGSVVVTVLTSDGEEHRETCDNLELANKRKELYIRTGFSTTDRKGNSIAYTPYHTVLVKIRVKV